MVARLIHTYNKIIIWAVIFDVRSIKMGGSYWMVLVLLLWHRRLLRMPTAECSRPGWRLSERKKKHNSLSVFAGIVMLLFFLAFLWIHENRNKMSIMHREQNGINKNPICVCVSLRFRDADENRDRINECLASTLYANVW